MFLLNTQLTIGIILLIAGAAGLIATGWLVYKDWKKKKQEQGQTA